MLFFGHLGLTLAFARAADKSIINGRSSACAIDRKRIEPPVNSRSAITGRKTGNSIVPLDYRFVLLGSLLPDLVDKSVLLVANESFRSGRLLGHTLIFSLVLLISGLIVYCFRRKLSIVILGASSLFHLLLDFMWNKPNILFWPLNKLMSSSVTSFISSTVANYNSLSINSPLKSPLISPVINPSGNLAVDFVNNPAISFIRSFADRIGSSVAHLWSTGLHHIPEGGTIHFNLQTARRILLDPYVCFPEIIGVLIILYFIVSLIRKKQVACFIKTGEWK